MKLIDLSHANVFFPMQAESAPQTLQVFDVDCYEFRTKVSSPSVKGTAAISDEHESEAVQLQSDGIDRSVGAVLLLHRLEHVHVLLLHDAETDSFRLPGGKKNNLVETDNDCLHRTLRADLAPQDFKEMNWRVQEYLGCWWRPQFSSKEMPLVLSQVSKPNQVSNEQFKHAVLTPHSLMMIF
jgi:hypothetical protein